MKHLRGIRKSKPQIDLTQFAPVAEKHCMGKCDKKVEVTKEGPVVVCLFCKRIVMDNRK